MHRLGVALLRAIMRRIGRRSSPGLRRFIAVMSAMHLWVHRWTRGLLGRRLGLKHGRILMLTTTGRKSGKPRTVPLLTIDDGDGLAVIASHGGLDQPPAWWLNLSAHPEAVVEIAGRRIRVVAKQADAQERARLWLRFVKAFPGYQDYFERTTREFPIVIFHPTG